MRAKRRLIVMTEGGAMEWTGGCLCGAVRYRASADPVRVVNCHCGMCRRTSGAAFMTFVHPGERVRLDRSAHVLSLLGRRRARVCPVCGSTLSMREMVLPDRGR